MTVWATEFLQRGMVTVRDALDPAFCEEVVARRLAELGVDEDDPMTWPSGRRNLPATTVHPLAEVAPRAAEVLHELVGGADRVSFSDLPDNLIVNFPDPDARWWPPTERWAAGGVAQGRRLLPPLPRQPGTRHARHRLLA